MKRTFSFVALYAVLMAGAACGPRSAARVSAPGADPAAYFERGGAAFRSDDYRDAIVAYERYLRSPEPGEETDRALFELAVAYTLTNGRLHNPERARGLLERLVRDYSGSPLRPQARALLKLQKEVDDMRSELEKLKEIDMERGKKPGGL